MSVTLYNKLFLQKQYPPMSLTFIALLGLIGQCVSVHLCPEFETDSIKTPQLKFSMLKNLMDDRVLQRNENEILINRTKIFKIKLDCWASYPIDLTFSGHLTNQQASVKNNINPFLKANGEKGYCYHINVTMETYEEVTGNYSCFAVTNPKLRASKYIYVFSAPPGVLLNRGQNITIEAKSRSSIVFPCAVSNPDREIVVELNKMDGNDRNWLISSRSLKFDPKIGYTMKLDNDFNPQLGDYQCRTAVSPMDMVNIRIVNPPEFKVEPNLRILRLKIGDRLNFTCMAQEDIYISLKPNSGSEITTLKNSTEKASVGGFKYVVNANIGGEGHSGIEKGGIVECLRKKDNSSIHLWQVVALNETRRHGILETSRIVESCPKSDETKSVVLYECNNWIECRINRCVGKDRSCQPSNRCQQWACNPHGLIHCVSQGVSISEIYFTGFNGTRYTNWMLAPKNEVLRLVMPKSVNGRGSKNITFVCEGSSFVIASGFQWSLLLNNGSSVDLKHSAPGSWGQTRSILTNSLTLPGDFYNQTLVKGLICFAPLWNSTGWINQTMEIDEILKLKSIHELEELSPRLGDGSTKPKQPKSCGTISSSILSSIRFLMPVLLVYLVVL